MREAAVAQGDARVERGTLRAVMAGVFLISFSLLAFEIALTRVLSVMVSYHFVFLVVSLALLGLGAGGILVHILQRTLPKADGGSPLRTQALFASLFAISIPLSVWAVTRLPALSWLFLFVPFFFAGALLTGMFRAFPALSSRIYGADLIGAAVGAAGAVVALDRLGGVDAVLVLGLVAAAGALLFAVPGSTRARILPPTVSLLVTSAMLGASLSGFAPVAVPVGTGEDKEIHHAVNAPALQGEIVETRWSAFGRTDLVSFRNDPGEMVLFVDGTAGTPMFRFNGNIASPNDQVRELKTGFPGYMPLANLKDGEKDNALIIGPGGGRDILLALLAEVGRITAVEVNPDMVDIVSGYASYNGGIYTGFDNVAVVVDEGRSFLKRSKEKYDIIMLSLPITKTSRSVEGYALTENFLFTTDSINDYLDRLTDEGRLIVVAHGSGEVLKLLSVSLAAHKQRGISERDVMDRVYIVGSEEFPVFVLKKTPFSPDEAQTLHRSIHDLGYDGDLAYLPTIKQGSCVLHEQAIRYDECSMLNPLFLAMRMGLVDLAGLRDLLSEYRLEIRPVSDDNPFFYKLEKGLPPVISLVVLMSAIVLAAVIPMSLRRSKKRTEPRRYSLRFAVLFAMLGTGFMLVEISAIQRFVLFLGQPVLALATLLFSLLVGAGIGSLYSDRFPENRMAKAAAATSLSTVGVLFAYALFLPPLLRGLLGLETGIRLLATFALLSPLGFLMGFPFPLGIRLLKRMRMENSIPWMWGINGISSVLGSALTIAVAISFGFTAALLLGAACYLAVFFISRSMSTKQPG